MNKQITTKRSVLCATLFGLAVLVPGIRAQSSYPVARAEIPFAFRYGSRVLPAGEYTVRMMSTNIMAIQGKPGVLSLGLVLREDGDKQPSRSKLVYRHQGSELLLRDVWVSGRGLHLQCPPQKLKTAKHQEIAAAKSDDPFVEVALADTPR